MNTMISNKSLRLMNLSYRNLLSTSQVFSYSQTETFWVWNTEHFPCHETHWLVTDIPLFFIDNSDKMSIVGLLIKNFFTLLSVVSISASYLIEMSQF